MSATATDLWLIRHPEPETSARGRCYGTLDVDLSPAGRRQAEDIAEALSAVPFAAIYSSPRMRCRYAAEALAAPRSCAVEIAEDFRELHFGDLEGRTYDEIARLHPELYARWMERPTETEFPGGETFQAMWLRVTAVCRELRRRHPGQAVACVTHGGVIRIALAEALCIPPSQIFSIAQRHGGISRIIYRNDAATVELVNAAADGCVVVGFE